MRGKPYYGFQIWISGHVEGFGVDDVSGVEIRVPILELLKYCGSLTIQILQRGELLDFQFQLRDPGICTEPVNEPAANING